MVSRISLVKIVGSWVATVMFAGCVIPCALAEDAKLDLSATAAFSTDSMFRSVSYTDQRPSAWALFDASYGMFYGYMWGSNSAFGDGLEIDYGVGIAPNWLGLDWNIAGLNYTFPGASDLNYFELRTSAARTFDKLTVSVGNWWSPNNFGLGTQSDAIELGSSYAFNTKLFDFFTPTLSAVVGWQHYEKQEIVPSYTYWNAGVTLGFLDRWSADIRYFDTDYSMDDCVLNTGGRNNCDARVVGTLSASF